MTEKSGVLNLGVEGMMLIGAIAAFATSTSPAIHGWPCWWRRAAGAAVSMIFAVLTLSLSANQVATGLALTIFGTGAVDAGRAGVYRARHQDLRLRSFRRRWPTIRSGEAVLGYSPLVYFSFIMVALVAWFLRRRGPG